MGGIEKEYVIAGVAMPMMWGIGEGVREMQCTLVARIPGEMQGILVDDADVMPSMPA